MTQEIPFTIAFLAGVFSFLSPCVLPIVPGFISYIVGKSFSDLQNNSKRDNLKLLPLILLFIFGFNYLKGTSLLDRQKTLYAVYDEVDGLLVGANVMINGLSIGNVTDLDFLPNSTKILVTIKVKDKLNFSSNIHGYFLMYYLLLLVLDY